MDKAYIYSVEKNIIRVFALCFCMMFTCQLHAKNIESKAFSIDKAITALVLQDQLGANHSLAMYHDTHAIVIFTHGIGCPIVRHMAQDFNNIAGQFNDKNIQFFMLNANIQDDNKKISSDSKEYNIQVPVLKDDTQALAKSLGLTRTAETVIIDPKDWTIIYRGPVSDRVSYETVKRQGHTNYLQLALEAVSNKQPIQQSTVRFTGCAISYL